MLIGLMAWRNAVLPLLEPDMMDAGVCMSPAAAVITESDGGEIAFAVDEMHGWSLEATGADGVIEPDEAYRLARRALRPRGEDAGSTHEER
jgi:hypothetical protein